MNLTKIRAYLFAWALLGGGSLSMAQAVDDEQDLPLQLIHQSVFEQAYQDNFQNRLDPFTPRELVITDTCYEICESFLVEKQSGKRMLLPANFDQGMLALMVSPSGKQFLVCSTYDGPDFADYYDYRAEIVLFRIGAGQGLEAIQLQQRFRTQMWSIEEIAWIDEQSLALKTYSGGRSLVEMEGNYSYHRLDW